MIPPNPSSPSVSVITATRNRPDVLKQALLSIKAQTFQDFEVLVVDDGSDPHVHEQYVAIWRELDDRFLLRCSRSPGTPGSDPGTGRNFGISLSKSEFIAFLDHDDFWLTPDYLEVALQALRAKNADYFFSDVRGERHGSVPLPWAVEPALLTKGLAIPGGAPVYEVPLATFTRVMRSGMIHPSHSIVRRGILTDIGGFVQGLKIADDVDLMFRIADTATKILYRPDCCVAVRLPDNKSYSVSNSQHEQMVAWYYAMLHARVSCKKKEVRRCLRSREGWILRELSDQMRLQGFDAEGLRLAYQSMAVWPSVGTAWFLMKGLLASTKRMASRDPKKNGKPTKGHGSG
jgi:glycosyltransferase involved in cell wall biosynthesis